MRHLVTGGAGFLGSLIVERLVERGDEVRVLDLSEDSQRPEPVQFFQGSVVDRDCVRAAMQGIDVVHHTVALVPLTKSGKKFREVNVLGSRVVVEEASSGGVQAFVHMSSSAVYGSPERCPIDSSTPKRPIEPYGRAKLEGEIEVRRICEINSLPLIVIRPRTILGAGRLGIFEILFDWISNGKRVYVIGSGEIPFQFVHADDLIDFYVLALDRGWTGDFNVGTDRYGTLREALENLISHAGTASRVLSLPERPSIAALQLLDWLRLSPLAPWHYLTYHKPFCFDVAPLLALGWKPKYSNDEMLRESYDWFCSSADASEAVDGYSPHRRPVRQRLLRLLRRLS